MDPLDSARVRARAHRHRLDDRARSARRATGSPASCARSATRSIEQPVARGCANVFATLDEPAVVFSTHFDCVPPFFPSRVETAALYRPRRVRREGHPGGAGRGGRAAAGPRRAARRPAVRRRRGAGQRRRGRWPTRIRRIALPDQRRADRQPARRRRRAACCACGCTREGRAAHSAAPEHGESAIEKLIDALVELRTLPLPVDPDLGATYYTVGLIEGGVAPNVDLAARARPRCMFRTSDRPTTCCAAIAAARAGA